MKYMGFIEWRVQYILTTATTTFPKYKSLEISIYERFEELD